MVNDGLALLGLAVLVVGVVLVFVPAGVIVAGVGLILFATARAKAATLEAQREHSRAPRR